VKKVILLISIVGLFISSLWGEGAEPWTIFLNQTVRNDAAIRVALDDLNQAGLIYRLQNDTISISPNSILIGAPERNALTAKLVRQKKLKLSGVSEPQGFEIITSEINGKKVLVVAGGSLLGEVYGLYWIWQQLKIHQRVPDLNIVRVPRLKIRFAGASTPAELRNALRYGATWVSGGFSVNHLVPWTAEPERTENQQNREKMRELIEYAHALHLKFLVYEDEFSFHPDLLTEFRATLSPADPAFWSAVQAKYRRLFQTLPEIDGVRLRTGESTRIGSNFQAFDVMHDGEGCDWSLAKRYRTWVKQMHQVVVGEFDKILFQRTWVTSAHEQHSMATVYQEIFTDDVPVEKLFLSPYLSTTDRYFHQPYNPTFNLTPHQMIVLLAPLDYHAQSGVNIVPTFPGPYFQGGLKTILAVKNTNLRGVDFGIPQQDGWDTRSLTAFTVSRLAWDPDEEVKQIARDFAAIHFGQTAAEPLAEILMQSANAYKYGLYIEPVAYGDFRSLPHLRLTTFPVMGFHYLDHGKKHLEFLYKIYLRCLPWRTETLLYLDHGLDIAHSMVEKFKPVKTLINDSQAANKVKNSIDLTYWLVKTNNLYVKSFFAYFDYWNDATPTNKTRLVDLASRLKDAMQQFRQIPACVYRLDGMEQLLRNIEPALSDLAAARLRLEKAPADDEVGQLIIDLQTKSAQVLKDYSAQAVKFLHWEGRIDGMDLLKVSGEKLEIEHLRYDHIQEMSYQILTPLPPQPVTIIPVPIQARSFQPFVLEQPSEKNDYTVTIFLSDFPEHGYSWWRFDLYYLPQPPEAVGLNVPW